MPSKRPLGYIVTMQPSPEFIPVAIDKSYITTIGERLYTESIEFVRELVNNAYDADATFVEFENAGHIVWRHNKEKFNSTLAEFYRLR